MQTGIIMFPSAIATGIMMPISGKLYDKFGAKPVVMPGLILLVFATWELSKVNMSTPLFTISMLMALRGLALGISMMPITTEGMNAVPLNKVAEASSINNAIRQVAGSLSITILTTVMQNFQDNRYAQLAVAVTPFNAQMNSAVTMIKGLMLQHRLNPNGAWVIVGNLLKQQAFVESVKFTLLVTTAIAALTIPLALALRHTKRVPLGEGEEVAHGALME